MKIKNLLLEMSYNMPKMLRSKFQSHSIRIEDFTINPLNPFNNKAGAGGHFKIIARNVL